jgi:hypothetical protein
LVDADGRIWSESSILESNATVVIGPAKSVNAQYVLIGILIPGTVIAAAGITLFVRRYRQRKIDIKKPRMRNNPGYFDEDSIQTNASGLDKKGFIEESMSTVRGEASIQTRVTDGATSNSRSTANTTRARLIDADRNSAYSDTDNLNA